MARQVGIGTLGKHCPRNHREFSPAAKTWGGVLSNSQFVTGWAFPARCLMSTIRAVGLLSGGLDSALAARLLLDQGIEVVGLHLESPTACRMRSMSRAVLTVS